LIDTQSNGAQVWAERYESVYKDVFDIQDEIAQQVTRAILGRLTIPLVPRQRPLSMEVFELSLRSRDNWIRSKSKTEEEIAKLSRAVSLDPAYARIHSQLALTHMWQWLLWETPGKENLDLAKKFAGRGVALGHSDPYARFVNAMVLLHRKQWLDADSEFDASLAIDPNGADVFASKAYMLAFSGNGVAGLECLKQALALNPRPPEWYNWHIAICCNALGRYDESIATIMQAGTLRGPIRRSLVYALSGSGQLSEAQKEAAIYLTEDPGFRAAAWIERLPYQDLNLRDRHLKALVNAGLPEYG
jgi:tetratricopeptide (TPR) repeat protein